MTTTILKVSIRFNIHVSSYSLGMIMHPLFLVFLLLEVSLLEISLINCRHKKTTNITSTSPTITTKRLTTAISTPPLCDYTECEATGRSFCTCSNHNYTSWPVPKKDTCPSIGCSLSSENCRCQYVDDYEHFEHWGHKVGQRERCICNEFNCNKTECAGRSLSSGCYCYFGDKAIKTDYMPASKECSDLLVEIGHHNGRYQCVGFSCKCDKYGDCVCKPPKNKNNQTAKPMQCDSEHCRKHSFEFCQCTSSNCS